MYFYQAYGLTLQSDVPLLGPQSIQPTTPDVTIQAAKTLPHIPKKACKVRLNYSHGNSLWLKRLALDFYITNGQEIHYIDKGIERQFPLHITLLGTCLGAILMQRGYTILHANTLQIGSTVTAFCGHSGAGKSTTSAYYLNRGESFIADDVTAITFKDEQAMVIPGFPRIKLWEDSLKRLQLAPEKALYCQNGQTKYQMTVPDKQVIKQARQLDRITILQKPIQAKSTQQKLSAEETLRHLLSQSYRYPFIQAMQQEKQHFKRLMRLAELTEVTVAERPNLELARKPVNLTFSEPAL